METVQPISDFAPRFQEFMDAHNLNPNRLAVKMCPDGDQDEIKKLRVKYGRWASGLVSPAYDGLVDIALAYDIDMNWFMLGQGNMKRSDAPGAIIPATDQDTAYVRKLEKRNEQLESRVEALIDQLMKLSELNFTLSDNRITPNFQPQYNEP